MGSRFIDFDSFRCRGYKMLLYADNPEHMRVLHRLRKSQYKDNYCGIWHILRDDLGREIVKGTGKKHAHIIIDLLNPVYWRSFCKNLGADPRFCMPICCDIDSQGRFIQKAGSNVKRGLVYLTHVAFPEKEQYSVTDIFGASEMIDKAQSAIDSYLSKNISMSDCAFYISEWIDSQNYITAMNFLRWVCGTPYFKAVSSPLVRAVFDEHNRLEMRKRERDLNLVSVYHQDTDCMHFDLSEFTDLLATDDILF